MALKLDQVQSPSGLDENVRSVTFVGNVEAGSSPLHDDEREPNLLVCRVCQCVESDRRGDAALGFLNITAPSVHSEKSCSTDEASSAVGQISAESRLIEFVSPEGEVFICKADVEAGSYKNQDTLIHLGCSCKNDLALTHYACALKWFVNHGSTVCEVCSSLAKNVQIDDFKKVVASLKDYEALRERTATGELNPSHVQTNSGVDPDAVAAIRRQRLSEISLWFNPQSTSTAGTVVSVGATDQSSNGPIIDAGPSENRTTKWAVESTGILVATGLLTVTLAWLIAPRVGKKTARSGLHILLGGICALTVVIFLRFIVLSRIKYGPARYWAILFVFWFLVFGIWASRTHSAHVT
ncbi:hypothetical protein H6P81_003334 [Aristolochia fimbriata]|uniref:RING-CH-type domain-containing protein n=1 Tax=Aristolochia fimbriata TaxID=158543 RepID=A0AAV7FDC8_ARIFI|nr:hypothetical protein H6P81_003334 [Aristolochia fimbriata]